MNGKIMLNCTQSRRVNALIRRECCNYAEGNCVLLDDGETHVCPQRITYSHIICKWFKNAVFPIDTGLYAELVKPKNTRICHICGSPYLATGRRSKYCENCRRTIRKRKLAQYQRRHREKRDRA